MQARTWTLVGVSIATFMLLLDVTVVNVALPDIQRDVGADFTDLQWVVDAYALTLAATLLIAGSLADRVGRRAVFVGGLVIFSAASLAAGLAGDALVLNLARGVQGLGGAAMFSTSLSLLAVAYPGAERAGALAIWGAVTAAAVAIGPLVGGALVETLGWEWVFFVNLPVGALAAALALTRMAESKAPPRAGAPDWLGAALLGGALSTLVLALLRGNDEGWGSAPIVALFAGSAVLLAGFVLAERCARNPILDLGLWRKPTTTGASLAMFAVAAAVFAQLLFLSLYLQNVLGHGALGAGLRLLPITVLGFLAAGLTARLAGRFPLRALVAGGLALCAVGVALQTGVDPGDGWTALLPGFVIAGIGVGLVNPTVAAAGIGIVHPARSGMAAGLNNTFRLVGVATGIAGLGAIFEARVSDRLAELAPGAPPGLAEAAATGALERALATAPPQAADALVRAGEAAFVAGLDRIFWVAAVVAAVGAVLSLALIRARDLVAPTPLEEAPESREPVPAAGA